MQILTLIPRADSYGIVLFILFGFASFSLSNFLYSRWFHQAGILLINIVVKTSVVMFGCLVLPIQKLFDASFLTHLFAIPIGLGIGYASVAFEKALMRDFFRKNLSLEKPQKQPPSISPRNLFGGNKTPLRRQIGAKRLVSETDVRLSWSHLMILAVLEELIFRGFIVTFFQQSSLPLSIRTGAILISIFIFGLSHLLNGNAQMKSKLFFAALATISSLILHTVTSAMIAHLYLNHTAYKLSKKWSCA